MNVSATTQLIACRDCGLLQPVETSTTIPGDAAIEAALEAYGQFLADHHQHELTWLARTACETSSDRPLWDPMATITFAATDGEHCYVVSGTRTSIEEPRVYHFAPGSVDAGNASVLVADQPLRRGLDLEFYPHALRLTKIEQFLSAVHDIIGHLDADELPIAFDDADDPAISIARMPDATYQELLTRCADIFDAAEIETVIKFLRENRDEDGLLALRVRRESRFLLAAG